MAKKQSVKREDAEKRQEKYDSLSHIQKVKRAQSRRGESKKELLRLTQAKSQAKQGAKMGPKEVITLGKGAQK